MCQSITITKTLTINKGKKDKKKKLTKADIGKPTDFKHISHAGRDPNQLDNMDQNMMKFFAKVRQLFNLISISSFVV